MFVKSQHANRYHLEEIEKQWFYNPGRKMYLPKPPEHNKKPNQVTVFYTTFPNQSPPN
jgi:hypothetical protein